MRQTDPIAASPRDFVSEWLNLPGSQSGARSESAELKVWWDKLHRTLRRDVPQDRITIGVAAYREEKELTLGKLLAMPFRQQREWRLPNGEIPDREPRPSDELAK